MFNPVWMADALEKLVAQHDPQDQLNAVPVGPELVCALSNALSKLRVETFVDVLHAEIVDLKRLHAGNFSHYHLGGLSSPFLRFEACGDLVAELV